MGVINEEEGAKGMAKLQHADGCCVTAKIFKGSLPLQAWGNLRANGDELTFAAVSLLFCVQGAPVHTAQLPPCLIQER